MNIVLLVDSLGFGGAQRQIVNLTVELKNEGHTVSFIRYRKDDFYLPLLKGYNIFPITIEQNNYFLRALKIRKVICGINPDIVISFMDSPNFYACIASFGKHMWKLITSERIANQTSFVSRKKKIIKRIVSKYADYIICNSKCAQNLWEKYYPESKKKLKTIHNILDVPDLPVCESNNDKCKILVAARYEQEKNLSGMLRAVYSLTDEEKSKLEVHWYGKANSVSDTESEFDRGIGYIKENHLEGCVFLHSATDQIYRLMSETDFIGLFSFMEGLPNSVIEGMYLHKPIIISKVSDYEVLVDESNGYLCEPKDDNDIADALRKAINTSPDDRRKMGMVSHEKICRLCSRDVVMNQWNDLLN